MRTLLAVAVLAAFATPAAAQDFVAEFNTEGTPQVPEDRRVAVDAGGAMQAWRGRPWWHVMAFCSGVFENAAYEAERGDDARRAETLRGAGNLRFWSPAIDRVMADRGVDEDAAAAVVQPDVNFHFLVSAEEGRPFNQDAARCNAYEAAYKASLAPAAAAPPPAPPAAMPGVSAARTGDRRFRAQADLTRRYDGETYWSLMLRCAMGSQGVAGRRGEMTALFGRTAMEVLSNDRDLRLGDARAALEAAAPGLEPIRAGTSEADDACIAIGRQLQAEGAGR